MIQPSLLTIDLEAYRANLRVLADRAPHSQLCAVVKANAYGHGLVPCAHAAVDAGAQYLGIVDNSEAAALRSAGIRAPILRLRPAILEEIQSAAEFGLEECIGSIDEARSIQRWANQTGNPLRYHLKLDTGMGRAGLDLHDGLNAAKEILKMDGLVCVGVMTHFPSADESEAAITIGQLERFHDGLRKLRPDLPAEFIRHAANSAATLRLPATHLDMIRPGIASDGLEPGPDCPLPGSLRPVMRWSTHLAQVRDVPAGTTIGYGMTYTAPTDLRVGTLPIGYANGYDRRLSGKAEVLVRGVRCPLLGRVSMNLVNIDLSPVPGATPGDEVVLLGCQEGQSIGASEMADWLGTITYEIATSLGRAERQNHMQWKV